jgi:hypothetical protein
MQEDPKVPCKDIAKIERLLELILVDLDIIQRRTEILTQLNAVKEWLPKHQEMLDEVEQAMHK